MFKRVTDRLDKTTRMTDNELSRAYVEALMEDLLEEQYQETKSLLKLESTTEEEAYRTGGKK